MRGLYAHPISYFQRSTLFTRQAAVCLLNPFRATEICMVAHLAVATARRP